MVRRDQPDRKEFKEQKVIPVQLEQQARLAHKDPLVRLEQLEQKVILELPEQMELTERKDRKV